MGIYKQNDIKRLAGTLLVKDFEDNKDFHFTNASYGNSGEVMGTIFSKNRRGEHLIQYILLNENWDNCNYDLIRTTTDTTWKTKTDEYKHVEDSKPVKRFYRISRDHYDGAVYTDDETYANQAREVRRKKRDLDNEINKRCKTNNCKLEGTHVIKSNTKLYDKLFTYAATTLNKPLKYGADLQVDVYKYKDRTRYTNGYTTKETGTEISMCISVLYRNKMIYCHKPKIFITEKIENF